MKTIELIGVAGPAGSGKDTVADFICSERGYIKYSLAAPMKAAVNGMLAAAGCEVINFNDRKVKEARHSLLGCSPRRFLQLFGTDFARNMINDSIWLNHANHFINKQSARGYGIVVPDIRYPNESSWLRERGGKLIHVIRPGVGAVEAHISEAGVEVVDGDIVVINDGSLNTLFSKVRDGLGAAA